MHEKKRRQLTAYLTDEEWEVLRAYCVNDERSMASVVTRIVRAWIEVRKEETSKGDCYGRRD